MLVSLLLLCLCLAFPLAGCGPGDPAVAEVDGEKILASDLRAFVERLPEGLKSPDEGDAARRQYLQSLVDRRLMLIEARARGLDTTRAVRNGLEAADRSSWVHLYRSRIISPQVVVDDESVRRRFTERGYDRERRLDAILVGTRDEIDAVVGRLEAGASFAEAARERSLDERSATQGGELGFVGIETARRLHIPPDVFRQLPTDELSRPLPAGKSWHVVRFTEDRPAEFSRYRQRLEDELFAEGARQAEAEELERLRARFEVALHAAGLSEIVTAYASRETVGLDTSSALLYSFRGGEVTVGAAQRTLRGGGVAPLADSVSAARVLERAVLLPRLFAIAARDQGLVDEEQHALVTLRREQDMLLEALRSQETGHVDVSEIEVRQFYDDHPESFLHERAVWAEELLLPTAAEAGQARSQLDNGADFAELTSRSLRHDAELRGARHHYHPREQALFPRLLPALMSAEPGVLTGPLEVDGGWSVFRVISIDEGGIEPFGSARSRARALLLQRHQQTAFGALLERLRRSYGERVTMHVDRLGEALPDSLL